MINDPNKQANQDIHLALGDSISAWATLEIILSTIFNELIRSDHGLVSYTVWDSVINFNAKLGCLNALIKLRVKSKKNEEVWAKLHSKIIKAAKKRNELAHSGIGSEKTKGKHEIVLMPYMSITAIGGWRGKVGITAKDIDKTTKHFRDLTLACVWFKTSISKQPQGFHGQLPDLIQQILEGLEKDEKP